MEHASVVSFLKEPVASKFHGRLYQICHVYLQLRLKKHDAIHNEGYFD